MIGLLLFLAFGFYAEFIGVIRFRPIFLHFGPQIFFLALRINLFMLFKV